MMYKTFFFVVIFLLSGMFTYAQKVEIISTKAAQMIENNNRYIVLDVRTPAEFAQGHVKGAINLDMKQPETFDKIKALDRNKKYIVYCRTRNRSGVVVDFMVNNGFTDIYHMIDGIIGWNQNNLPVEK